MCCLSILTGFSSSYSSLLLLFDQIELIRRDYVANGGWETFLSYEDPEQDILIGLLRLRKCSEESFRPELKGGVSIVRELHVYGSVVPVSSRDPSKFQHQVPQTIFIFHLYVLLLPTTSSIIGEGPSFIVWIVVCFSISKQLEEKVIKTS